MAWARDQALTHPEHWFPPVNLPNVSGTATQPNANFLDPTELVSLLQFMLLTSTLEISRFLGFWTLPPPGSRPASVSVPPPSASHSLSFLSLSPLYPICHAISKPLFPVPTSHSP